MSSVQCAMTDQVRWVHRGFLGAGDRVRTGDIQLGKLTLYQLSYARAELE